MTAPPEAPRLSLRLPPAGETGGIRISWHNVRTYLQCPFLWYLENLAPHPDGGTGYRGKYSSRAPFVGLLVHGGLHGWVLSGWRDGKFENEAGHVALLAEAEAKREQIPYEDDWSKFTAEAQLILTRHMDYCGPDGPDPDWEKYRIIDVDGEPMLEREWEIDLGYNGYVWTSRLDVLGQRCNDEVISAIETKTVDAGRAVAEERSKQLDPQLTGEQFCLAQTWPDLRTGVTLNHIVKRAAADKTPRGWHVQDRSPARLEQFRIQMVRTLQSIDDNVAFYRDLMQKGMPEEEAGRMAFSNQVPGDRCARPGHTCMAHYLCDYAESHRVLGATTRPKFPLPGAEPAKPKQLRSVDDFMEEV